MALIEIKAEPKILLKLVEVLERIASGIERAFPPPIPEGLRRSMKPAGPDDLFEFDPGAEFERELYEEERREQGR